MNHSIKGTAIHKTCPQKLYDAYNESIEFIDSLYRRFGEQIDSIDIIVNDKKAKVKIKFKHDENNNNSEETKLDEVKLDKPFQH